MAAIFNDVVIQHGDKSVSVKPTFEMINRIEMPAVSGGLGISLAGLTARISRGDVPVSEVARVIAFMLRSSGEAASSEDIYVDIMTRDDALQVVEVVATAFFPVVRKGSEKSESSAKKK